MKLSKENKIILINQYRILALLKKDETKYYNELISILENGYTPLYYKIEGGICDDIPVEDGELINNILTMYRVIEDLKINSGQTFDNYSMSYFTGFDGNNESTYLSYTMFLIEEQGLYQEQHHYFSKHGLNTHSPMLSKYKRMTQVWEHLTNKWEINQDDVIKIFEAGE